MKTNPALIVEKLKAAINFLYPPIPSDPKIEQEQYEVSVLVLLVFSAFWILMAAPSF